MPIYAGEVSTDNGYVVEADGGAPRFTVAALDLGIKTNTRVISRGAASGRTCCRRPRALRRSPI